MSSVADAAKTSKNSVGESVGEKMNPTFENHMNCSFYGAFVAAGVVFGLMLSGCDTQVARQTPSTPQKTHPKSGESRTAEVDKQPPTEPAASNQTVANLRKSSSTGA